MTSSPAPDLEPRTEAGRRFLEDLTKEHCSDPYGCHAADDSLAGMAVFAIEAEAAADSGRLREALTGLRATLATMTGGYAYDADGNPGGAVADGYRVARRDALALVDALLATPPAPSDHGAGERE